MLFFPGPFLAAEAASAVAKSKADTCEAEGRELPTRELCAGPVVGKLTWLCAPSRLVSHGDSWLLDCNATKSSDAPHHVQPAAMAELTNTPWDLIALGALSRGFD